jgi:hypothetical protein
MEKFLPADLRPIERGGQHNIEIKQGERGDEEIGLVRTAEFHGLYPLSPQKKDSGEYDTDHENEC